MDNSVFIGCRIESRDISSTSLALKDVRRFWVAKKAVGATLVFCDINDSEFVGMFLVVTGQVKLRGKAVGLFHEKWLNKIT